MNLISVSHWHDEYFRSHLIISKNKNEKLCYHWEFTDLKSQRIKFHNIKSKNKKLQCQMSKIKKMQISYLKEMPDLKSQIRKENLSSLRIWKTKKVQISYLKELPDLKMSNNKKIKSHISKNKKRPISNLKETHYPGHGYILHGDFLVSH